jgi:large subunit ribosomal protein L3
MGGSIEDQFNYLNELLGKTINISDVFAEGQYIDVIAITKGKGIQGPVKRWGVKKRHHKSRKTVRGVATLGPWSPHYVMYTVPRAGQMGFHQRTERNKRILKINLNGEDVNPRGGFAHYGVIRSSNILLSGSTPGPAKRILKFRFAEKAPSRATVKPPQITYSSIKSK